MAPERQQDVTDLGEQLGLDPRPLETPAHSYSTPITARLVVPHSGAPGRLEVRPGSASEGSTRIRIRSGAEPPPGDESLEGQVGFYNIVRGALAIWYKRLEVGGFQVPDAGDRDGIELDPAQLAMILSGIDLETARRRQRFRATGPSKSKGDSPERDLHNSNDRV